MKYQNIHTQEVLEVAGTEVVAQDRSTNLTIFILEDGSRWSEEVLNQHWRPIVIEQHSGNATASAPSHQGTESASVPPK